jgi:mRNA interferase MazF
VTRRRRWRSTTSRSPAATPASRDRAISRLALSTVVICPTSQSAPAASFHPEVAPAGEPTRVLCEMVGAVDARALGDQVDHLGFDEMRSVDDALRLVLDLS